ncbi:MAG: DUF2797 domain-containing protein [gamma proteobacterium symbiont of Lucinoma myriamae]|nr:DUF2797 domain-containing protein [gamma proteobacterium symbiont of Lucinoma myriamae]MCU7817503.1 DUF2797 domain-containing protein [gamma proteobacterium symbiont of Lucinoma myriamae]MCU7831080.1 DUF2797 domain-containing protein [gamma proteobacterium symbiont of Lucinoma myriamae]
MTVYTGHLRKMRAQYENSLTPVEYSLVFSERSTMELDKTPIILNSMLGKRLTIQYKNEIHCVSCGRKSNKSFNQGHCYPCFTRLASCDKCIMSPEKCHFEQGTCREPEWGQTHCMQSHYVYLANSSGLKVGITRGDQLPTRWIDQGAIQALPIYKVSQRYYSGLVEVLYKQEVSDRTQWQRMLKGQVEEIPLLQKQTELYNLFAERLDAIQSELPQGAIAPVENDAVTEILYPVEEHPQKVKSFNLDKQPLVEGTLMGIKGQYLILDTGVINIRKFSGYHVDFEVSD